jgi:hypothetical protein
MVTIPVTVSKHFATSTNIRTNKDEKSISWNHCPYDQNNGGNTQYHGNAGLRRVVSETSSYYVRSTHSCPYAESQNTNHQSLALLPRPRLLIDHIIKHAQGQGTNQQYANNDRIKNKDDNGDRKY